MKQFDCNLGRSAIGVIHLTRRLMKLYRDRKKDFHIIFIDLERAHDRVSRVMLLEVTKYTRCAKDICSSYQRHVSGSK